MAVRGPKPKPDHLRLVSDPVRKVERDPALDIPPGFDNGLQSPSKLTKRQQELWNKTIRRLPWLTEFDVYAAYEWVRLQAKFEKSTDDEFNSGLRSNLRALRSELGMEPASRTRVKATDNAKANKASKFFD